MPLGDIKSVESGRAADVRLGRIRSILAAQDGRFRVTDLVEKGRRRTNCLTDVTLRWSSDVVALMKARGWDVYAEVSFSEFGERGSIDVLALRSDLSVALVLEIKTAIGSLEETNRVFDAKVRLAPAIVQKRFGWRPKVVGCALVLPARIDPSPNNRSARADYAGALSGAWPTSSGMAAATVGPLRGLWFLSNRRNTTSVQR